jgi:hypothetical protein
MSVKSRPPRAAAWWLAAAMLVAAQPLAGCAALSCDCTAFFDLNEGHRKEKFKTYPIEKQLALYRCAMQREPPNRELAYYIAEGGPGHIPLLLERLKSASEPDKADIIYVFKAMSILGKLDCRQDVVEQAEQAAAGLRVKVYRDNALGDVAEMKKGYTCQTAK